MSNKHSVFVWTCVRSIVWLAELDTVLCVFIQYNNMYMHHLHRKDALEIPNIVFLNGMSKE